MSGVRQIVSDLQLSVAVGLKGGAQSDLSDYLD
jgi:hypothetical protein